MQNAIKVYSQFPDSIMDIVKSTDPSTVTQHGLYMRPLGHTSILPSPTSTPPSAPQTPPQACSLPESSATPPITPQTTTGVAPPSGLHAEPENSTDPSTALSSSSLPSSFSSSSAPLPYLAVNLEIPCSTPSDRSPKQAPDNTADCHDHPSDSNISHQNPNHNPNGSTRKGQGGEGGSEGVCGRGRVTLLGDSAHATIPNGQLFVISQSCGHNACLAS